MHGDSHLIILNIGEAMQKLAAVEEAKALMREAQEWPVWRWLLEKGRVRAAADRANEALAAQEKKVKAAWPDELKTASHVLARRGSANNGAGSVSPLIKAAVEKIKAADATAEAARLDAEATFDEAERRLSASMAREGTEKAIHSWELREKAIRKAEAAGREQTALNGPHSAGA